MLAPGKSVPKHFFQAQSFARTFALYGSNLDSINYIIFPHIYYLFPNFQVIETYENLF